MNSEHEKKYNDLCKRFGLAWNTGSPRLVNETLASLTQKHEADPHMNNVPLRLWDSLAIAFLSYNRGSGLSLAEAVCMQKHAAAKMLATKGADNE